MRLITCNSQDNPDMPRRDVVKTAALLNKRASVIGFQELGEKEDHTDSQKGLPSYVFTHPRLECSLAIDPTVWRIVSTGRELTHEGLDHASPNRYNAWVILQSVIRPKLPPIAVVNTHMTVKSQTSKLAHPRWRANMWDRHLRMLQATVHGLSNGGKTTVFVMGDFNSSSVPIPGVKWMGNNGIDKIGVLPSRDLRIIKKGTFRIPTPSDHDALGLAVQLKRN